MRTPTAFRADPEGPKATKPIPLALENHPSAFYRASLHCEDRLALGRGHLIRNRCSGPSGFRGLCGQPAGRVALSECRS